MKEKVSKKIMHCIHGVYATGSKILEVPNFTDGGVLVAFCAIFSIKG
jgi:hypothetical protein